MRSRERESKVGERAGITRHGGNWKTGGARAEPGACGRSREHAGEVGEHAGEVGEYSGGAGERAGYQIWGTRRHFTRVM